MTNRNIHLCLTTLTYLKMQRYELFLKQKTKKRQYEKPLCIKNATIPIILYLENQEKKRHPEKECRFLFVIL